MLYPEKNIAIHPQSQAIKEFGIKVKRLNPRGKEKHTLSEPHRHDYYEIILLEKGSGIHAVDFEEHQMHDNACYLLAPDSIHHFDTITKAVMQGWLLEISKEYMQTLDGKFGVLFCKNRGKMTLTIPENDKIKLASLFQLMLMEQENKQAQSNEIIAGYLKILMLELARQLETEQQEEAHKPDERFVAFLEWVEILHKEVKSITAYADKVHLSHRQLNRICLEHTGKTANQILNERVNLEAKRLLFNNSASAKETGYALGFDDPSNFIKFFKRHNGQSPTEFKTSMSKIYHQ